MSLTEELERLQALRERGALSEMEFERAKARLIGESGAADPTAAAAGGAGLGSDPAGVADSTPFVAERSFLRQLARSRSDRYLGGVCGGLGRHTDLPAWAWRLIFILVTLYFGSGVLFYVLLWIFLPLEA